MKKQVNLIAAAFWLCACGSGKTGETQPTGTPETSNPTFTGSITGAKKPTNSNSAETKASQTGTTTSSWETVTGTKDSGSTSTASNMVVKPKSHLPEPETCAAHPMTEPFDPALEGDCKSDADCSEGPYGRCGLFNKAKPHCVYDECMTSDDCAANETCGCGITVSTGTMIGTPRNDCRPSNCRSDADCGTDGYCSRTLGFCGPPSGTAGFYCRTTQDTCVNDEDCREMGSGYCAYQNHLGHWACSYTTCD